ncbi:MAG: rod shape-determining protein MreD [Winogradskyella sp.]|uniref:rod shape-determining protein MreD n=1 Tax=Winogradskyella sp. TaxID=1883156 RepID=UPI00181A2917|nr:rod shape-determining protein MreD [Winogradskyella sp.]MBT8244511.1 rod shape-determining protein MreD [Winogradskyella sp.]NNK23953.1 rod shape-determining protein MreD [Winogradskyella sp.]
MNNSLASNIIRFIVLLLVQVTICSNINLFGYINPFIYIIFILLFPVNNNRLLFLVIAFSLGLFIDVFLDSGGVHAAASVFLAYARPLFLKYVFGTLYNNQTIKFSKLQLNELVIYVSFMTLFHHFLVFNLEIFNISQILLVLKKTLISSLLTAVLSILIILLFKSHK